MSGLCRDLCLILFGVIGLGTVAVGITVVVAITIAVAIAVATTGRLGAVEDEREILETTGVVDVL